MMPLSSAGAAVLTPPRSHPRGESTSRGHPISRCPHPPTNPWRNRHVPKPLRGRSCQGTPDPEWDRAALAALFPPVFMKNTATPRKETVTETSPNEEKSNRPLSTIWVEDVGASVWSRDAVVKGQPATFYSVTLERSYRDRDGNRKYTKSFDADSLPSLIAACQKAVEAIAGFVQMPPAMK